MQAELVITTDSNSTLLIDFILNVFMIISFQLLLLESRVDTKSEHCWLGIVKECLSLCKCITVGSNFRIITTIVSHQEEVLHRCIYPEPVQLQFLEDLRREMYN